MKKKRLINAVAVTFAAALALGGCGEGREADTEPADSGGTETSEENEGGEGFASDAVIGVSLPWLGTQNWAEAEAYFTEQLTDAGFTPIVQTADNRVPQQQQQIETMIEQGAEVIVVGPIDGTQLGTVLEQAKDAGIYILGYDRMVENTDAVDGVVQFGAVRTGELQGQALLDGLAELKGEPPYNVELFAGGPADPNAPLFFDGAMSVLQPAIDDGTIVIVSGQTDFTQAATQDWDNSRAQARMDSLLSGFYSDIPIHGALSPNDGIARAIITSAQQAGQDVPVVSGLDAENESVVSIWEGVQYSTVAKPSDDLVAETVRIISALQAGEGLPEPTETVDNGTTEVGVYLLDPLVVTLDNIEEAFAGDAERSALLQ